MSSQQHPAPARAGWSAGVGLDWSVHIPGSLFWGLGRGSWRALCGAACSFWPFACGVPILEAPKAGREGSLASNICQGTSILLTSAGARKRGPGVICSGHLVGCLQPVGSCLPVPLRRSHQQALGHELPSALQGPVKIGGTHRLCDPHPPW